MSKNVIIFNNYFSFFLWLSITYQGGDVLQKFLDTASNYQASSVIYVEPGVYDPPNNNVTKGALSIIGAGLFPDDTVIRGKYWNAASADIGRSWLNFNPSRNSLLSNVTLSGATVINGSNYADIAEFVRNCNVFDCSCIMSSNSTTANMVLARYGSFYNCHISGCDGFTAMTRYSGAICDSHIHHLNFSHNTVQVGTFGDGLRRCYVHHIKTNANVINGSTAYACIFEELSGTGADFCYGYSTANLINCILIRNRGYRSYLALSLNKNNVFTGCYDTTGTYVNMYRAQTTGTSANYRVYLNNVFDLPLSQCRDFQTAINNSDVAGKYVICNGNVFNAKLSTLGFVDSDGGNFRLTPNSPLISAGSIRSNFTIQRDNETRTYPVGQLDLLHHRFKTPNPSIGPIQYYPPSEGVIPNYSYPMGK